MKVERMARSAKKSVTIKDVANLAGVSLATASRALSGHGYVSPEARQRVQQAAHELHFKPDGSARSLKLKRTNTVGLMIADIANPFYSQLADGVLDCAKRLGYHVILCATDEDPAMEREYLEVLMERRVDGILAVPTGHNLKLWREAADLGTRLVLVDREIPDITDLDVVLVDNATGARSAITYLLELGHRRIGIISGPTTTTTGKDRLQGYYDALRAAEVPVEDRLVQLGSFKRETGLEAARRLLSLPDPVTAIFAANNVLGEATIVAIRERGLRVPDDVSLVLFDDVPWASLTNPALTVVAQPTYDLGFVAMERLANRLQDADRGSRPPLKTVLRTDLVIRESCRSLVPRQG